MIINRDHLTASLGLIFIIFGAMVDVNVPWKDSAIPVTGQSLAVLVVAFVLGRKIGMLVIAVYLILGLFGLPIFANGASGISTLMGGSGGFLYGFLVGGYACGLLQEKGYERTYANGLVAMAAGTALILVCGIVQLTFLYDFEKALQYGFLPFWPGAIVKIILGAAIVYYIPLKRYTEKHN